MAILRKPQKAAHRAGEKTVRWLMLRPSSDGTARHLHIMLFEKKLRRRVGLHVVISHTEQSRKPVEHADIIVNKIHCKCVGHSMASHAIVSVAVAFPTLPTSPKGGLHYFVISAMRLIRRGRLRRSSTEAADNHFWSPQCRGWIDVSNHGALNHAGPRLGASDGKSANGNRSEI
jgi:hypothetical protein